MLLPRRCLGRGGRLGDPARPLAGAARMDAAGEVAAALGRGDGANASRPPCARTVSAATPRPSTGRRRSRSSSSAALDELIERRGDERPTAAARSARADRPGRLRPLRGLLPRLGHLRGRRQAPSERRRAPGGRATTRSACCWRCAQIIEVGPAAAGAGGGQPGAGVHGRGRAGLPTLVRGHGRHGEPRGPPNGQGAAGARVRDAGRAAVREDALPARPRSSPSRSRANRARCRRGTSALRSVPDRTGLAASAAARRPRRVSSGCSRGAIAEARRGPEARSSSLARPGAVNRGCWRRRGNSARG